MRPPSDVHSGASPKLERLLDELRAEPIPERSREQSSSVEARLLEAIDGALQTPLAPPKRWIIPAAAGLLLAAAIALLLIGSGTFRDAPEPITAEQDRAPRRLDTTPTAARTIASAAPAARSAGDETATKPRAATPGDAPLAPEQTRTPMGVASAEATSTDAEPPASTLAAENRLFERATRAERAGDANEALAALEQLLNEYPRSPLAQQAMVRRFRALERAGRIEAAGRAAQVYLDAYPTGFAASEARARVQASQQPPSGAGP